MPAQLAERRAEVEVGPAAREYGDLLDEQGSESRARRARRGRCSAPARILG
ncbi:hypothetical protein ACIQ8D_24925 [Streptomyces sp. NPDC096094]|uniref:hypothetical protein n=1 Tax=Streptomyces sp. NPDC096094 TaxID=3366073 RepID=UPI00380A5D2F